MGPAARRQLCGGTCTRRLRKMSWQPLAWTSRASQSIFPSKTDLYDCSSGTQRAKSAFEVSSPATSATLQRQSSSMMSRIATPSSAPRSGLRMSKASVAMMSWWSSLEISPTWLMAVRCQPKKARSRLRRLALCSWRQVPRPTSTLRTCFKRWSEPCLCHQKLPRELALPQALHPVHRSSCKRNRGTLQEKRSANADAFPRVESLGALAQCLG
mmetsp:Transcript_129445/g.224789  ORF Transcript_129445/g.224789 Transcript_129445/m.224789 type:complete len:213 (-) Transcript_129445:9-647(-)